MASEDTTNENNNNPMEVELTDEQKKHEIQRIFREDLLRNIRLIERGIAAVEIHYVHRALRALPSLRKRIEPETLGEIITMFNNGSIDDRASGCLKLAGEIIGRHAIAKSDNIASAKACEPEVSLYLCLLVQLHLLDKKEYEKGAVLSQKLTGAVFASQRRTVDPISSRIFFQYSRFYELTDVQLEARPVLLNALQTAALLHMKESRAMLLTLLLRNYIHYKHYEQAERLAAKTNFPADAPNSLLARYLYYMGRIEAVQLNYSLAYTHLLEATRKAPSSAATAGFQQTVHKLFVIVELLMGNIPERSLFRQPVLKKPLQPYLELTQAVRIGDLTQFQAVVNQYKEKFLQDQVLALIQRLRHNVIKAGIRSISLAYSRISLRDICLKLHLDSEEDAEYIVAKAIRDDVIDATINHEIGFVKSAEAQDVYSTSDPQVAFNKRIIFCLNLYNESVKAMRFPGSDHRKELASAAEAARRERELAQELASEEYDENPDDDIDDDDDAMDEGL